ncbi:MAG: sulfate ABC transporter substrate-binding protein [Ardenticatenaceae bacterium]|nr:sulfate ABC transporter substrate-binding protein [Ardenticatenaceae bacterium]
MRLKRMGWWRRWLSLIPATFFIALGLYALWPWLPFTAKAAPTRTIVFYGFSITGDAMNRGIFPAFQNKWETETGERVEFISAFGSSGTVTNQLIMGVPAEVALLALELDAQRLADAGVIAANSWQALPNQGVVNRSPFIILVRPGNPLAIHDFADLTQPGVRIVHPDPLTSGAANWSVVAEYGAGVDANPGNPNAGYEMLLGIWRNVVAQASSARAARTQFENGFGDVLITYEQDVLRDVANGRLPAEIITPSSTIFSEHTLVVLDKNIDSEERPVVDAFVAFLWSEEAQQIFADYGFRSVDEAINASNPLFGTVRQPRFIADFGGWSQAKPEIIEAIWKNQVLKELDQ